MPFRSMLVAAAFVAGATVAVAAPPTTSLPIKRVYVVGDSLSDQGNLFFATGYLNRLFEIPLPPSPDALHYENGRFADGPNYVDYLAQMLGVPIQPSALGGTNYAFGGSRTTYNRAEFRDPLPPGEPQGGYPVGAFPWSLEDQRAEFLAEVKKRKADPTGLYIVFHGSNDLADALGAAAAKLDPIPYVRTAVQGVVDAVLTFKAAGARTILVPLMPNLGVVPGIVFVGASQPASDLSRLFNMLLVPQLAQIQGPNIILFDTYAFLTHVVEHGPTYGLTNTIHPCYTGFVSPHPAGVECPNPEQYAFWDREHPTTRVHQILAQQLFSTVLGCEAKQKDKGKFTAHCAVNKH